MLDYVLLGAAAVIIIFALRYFINIATRKNSTSGAAPKRKNVSFAKCPLCNSPLYKQDLFSRVFRPMTVNDQRCIILGCPHCYPRMEAGIRRVCPVCHKPVPTDGHLVARLFNKTKDGKKHVVITGCSECCKYERKPE